MKRNILSSGCNFVYALTYVDSAAFLEVSHSTYIHAVKLFRAGQFRKRTYGSGRALEHQLELRIWGLTWKQRNNLRHSSSMEEYLSLLIFPVNIKRLREPIHYYWKSACLSPCTWNGNVRTFQRTRLLEQVDCTTSTKSQRKLKYRQEICNNSGVRGTRLQRAPRVYLKWLWKCIKKICVACRFTSRLWWIPLERNPTNTKRAQRHRGNVVIRRVVRSGRTNRR